jgi:hypothetical protein
MKRKLLFQAISHHDLPWCNAFEWRLQFGKVCETASSRLGSLFARLPKWRV